MALKPTIIPLSCALIMGTILGMILEPIIVTKFYQSELVEDNSDHVAIAKVNFTEEQRYCLALNTYHEAKGESDIGQRATTYATINRTLVGHKFGGTKICDVIKYKCQFSWWCDEKKKNARPEKYDAETWNEVLKLTNDVLDNYTDLSKDITRGAVYFHSTTVKPSWRTDFIKTGTYGTHIFYTEKDIKI